MSLLADELIQLAVRLLWLDHDTADQATLRRAVSTAYYALFHLLISDATLNWGRAEHRSQLGRLFDHGNMRKASEKIRADFNKLIKKKSPTSPDVSETDRKLFEVAEAFVRAQQGRIDADYVVSLVWTHDDAALLIDDVEKAFATWRSIRNEPAAQDYLVAMLSK